MTKAVLITGGCGFVGRYLMWHYLRLGWFVIILDDLSTGTLDQITFHPRLSIHLGSVLDLERLAPLVASSDLIIHLASVVGVRLAHSIADHAYSVCVQGTANVIACSSHQPLVLVSSSAVYGLDRQDVVFEEGNCDEASTLAYDGGILGYATGKLHMEAMGHKAARAGRKILLVRPFNLVGPGQSSHYGMVLPTFVIRALMGLPLQVYDDGSQTRSFGDIEVFVSVLSRLIETPAAWSPENFIVNIGNPTDTSIITLGRIVIDVCDVNGAIEFVPYHSVFPGRKDTRVRIPGLKRINTLVGEVEWTGIREIVHRVVQYERSRLEPSVTPLISPIPLTKQFGQLSHVNP